MFHSMTNLGKIAAVTISISDLNRMVEVYQEFLKYRVTKTGQITTEESSAWGADFIADLSFTKDIRAMQVIGPANEILYLTQFKKNIPEFDIPKPRCSVDKTFIVVLAGKSLDEMQNYFHDNFGLSKATIIESRIRSISRAFHFPEDTKYKVAALALKGQSMIELDELPKEGNNRSSIYGYLPAGIAMVSFLYFKSGARFKNTYLSSLPSHESTLCSVQKGSNNELIELMHC